MKSGDIAETPASAMLRSGQCANQLRAGTDAELAVDGVELELDGAARAAHVLGDFIVAHAPGNQLRNAAFAWRQLLQYLKRVKRRLGLLFLGLRRIDKGDDVARLQTGEVPAALDLCRQPIQGRMSAGGWVPPRRMILASWFISTTMTT